MLRYLRRLWIQRKFVTKNQSSDLRSNGNNKKIDFKQIDNDIIVPQQPVHTQFSEIKSDIVIDTKTIQLLERLSLVNLDNKEALKTLISSIQFADKITHIDTVNVDPLISVLEWQPLYLSDDVIREGDCREKVLHNAKITEEDYFVAPPGNIPLEQEEKPFIKKEN